MRDDVCGALLDALRAGELVLEFTDGIDFNQYERNVQLRSAVERQLEIIGEALVRVRRRDSSVLLRIPDSAEAIGLRNVIIHAYDNIDSRRVWQIIRDDLPTFCVTLRTMLEEG